MTSKILPHESECLCPAAEPQPGNRQRTDRKKRKKRGLVKDPSTPHQTTMRPFLKACNRNVLTHSRRPVVSHLLPAIGVSGGQFLLKPKSQYGSAWYSQKNSNKAPHNDPPSESQQQKEKEKKKRKTGSQSSKNSLRKVAAQAGHAAGGTGRTRVLHPHTLFLILKSC